MRQKVRCKGLSCQYITTMALICQNTCKCTGIPLHTSQLRLTAISNARKQAGITQEALGEQLNMTRKHISVIESAIKRPSLDALVDIANALDVSTDDLLVDSLMHSTSTSNSEIHRLLLDCNEIEQEILTRMVREMKAILYGLGI